MRALVLGVLGTAALWVAPRAEASHWHYLHGPYLGIGYGFYPYYHSPWYGPHLRVGIRVGDRHPARRARATERAEQRTLKLYVYPAAGQSEAQTADDRYECHVFGAEQSGHDPTLGTGTRDEAESYTRAFSACMEGRSYVVK